MNSCIFLSCISLSLSRERANLLQLKTTVTYFGKWELNPYFGRWELKVKDLYFGKWELKVKDPALTLTF